MKLLIEDHPYSFDLVKNLFPNIDELDVVDGVAKVNYVGYYYHAANGESVFILPKVVLDQNENVFGHHDPADIVDLMSPINPLSKNEREFIYGLSVWIYRAIAVYRDNCDRCGKDRTIVRQQSVVRIGKGKKRLSNTFLDIILSLIDFNKQNQDWVMFIQKNNRRGYNKINWSRTISTSEVVVQDDEPIYLDPITKKREINFDEELLVIFFSILNHIREVYGFPVILNLNYDFITGKRFDRYLNKGYGIRRLRQIKYKYFSDKALQLWDLCFAFFEQSKQIRINARLNEFLLVKNFNIVFEAIIDELIGDHTFPNRLNKKQEDGKEVDHMYLWDSLTNIDPNKQVYYIGDSKYYKQKNKVTDESVAKQYTYARNVIQWNLNLFFGENADEKPIETDFCLRDPLTEGYNIVPNFFISATMPEFGKDTAVKSLYVDTIEHTKRKFNTHVSQQYRNRLFDRDTLLITHYDVNFLYVVSLYARDNAFQKKGWRIKVRNIFRDKIREVLNAKYNFYAMRAKLGVVTEDFINRHFKEINGKIFAPYEDRGIVSLALQSDPKFDSENESVYTLLSDAFEIVKCDLGSDPRPLLPPPAYAGAAPALQTAIKRGVLMLTILHDEIQTLIATRKQVAVGLKYVEGSAKIIENLTDIGFLMVHKKFKASQLVFPIESLSVIMPGQIPEDCPVYPKDKEIYLLLKLGAEDTSLISALDCSLVKPGYDATYSTLEQLSEQKHL